MHNFYFLNILQYKFISKIICRLDAIGAGHIVVEIRALSLSTPPLSTFHTFLMQKMYIFTLSNLGECRAKQSRSLFIKHLEIILKRCCCSTYRFWLFLIIWRACHVKHCESAMWKIWHKTNSCSLSSLEARGERKSSLKMRKMKQENYLQKAS